MVGRAACAGCRAGEAEGREGSSGCGTPVAAAVPAGGGRADVKTWRRDQPGAALAGAAEGGYRHGEAITARMVDAQAPGIAAVLRRVAAIPASGDGWPGRLLGEYALLHLLARAHDHVDA